MLVRKAHVTSRDRKFWAVWSFREELSPNKVPKHKVVECELRLELLVLKKDLLNLLQWYLINVFRVKKVKPIVVKKLKDLTIALYQVGFKLNDKTEK
jgi:type II secretory pathway component PulC